MKVAEQPLSFSIVILALIISVLTTISAAQSIQKKPTQRRRAANPSFTCPDSEAQQACKSYAELLKAKDTGLPLDAYVCFRKSVDEFFLISFSQPYFRTKWDPDSKQMVVDYDYTPPGRGSARTYKNGIEDSSAMPSLFFSGQWYPVLEPEEGMFVSDKINSKKSDESDHDVGVSIDESQVKKLSPV